MSTPKQENKETKQNEVTNMTAPKEATTQMVAPKEEPVKLQALKSFIYKEQEIKAGDVFHASEKEAEILCKPKKGHYSFSGEMDQNKAEAERHSLQRAKRVN